MKYLIITCFLIGLFSRCNDIEENTVSDKSYSVININTLTFDVDTNFIESRATIFCSDCDLPSKIGIKSWLNDTSKLSINYFSISSPTKDYKITQKNYVSGEMMFSSFFSEEYGCLIIVEIKQENPNSKLYFLNSNFLTKILLIDSNFVLNKKPEHIPTRFNPPPVEN